MNNQINVAVKNALVKKYAAHERAINVVWSSADSDDAIHNLLVENLNHAVKHGDATGIEAMLYAIEARPRSSARAAQMRAWVFKYSDRKVKFAKDDKGNLTITAKGITEHGKPELLAEAKEVSPFQRVERPKAAPGSKSADDVVKLIRREAKSDKYDAWGKSVLEAALAAAVKRAEVLKPQAHEVTEPTADIAAMKKQLDALMMAFATK